MMSQIVRLQLFGDDPEVWLERWQVWTLKENPRSLWHSLGCESQLTTASDSERWMCFTHMDHTLVQMHQGDCVRKETWASNSKNKWTARVLALHYWPPQHPLPVAFSLFCLSPGLPWQTGIQRATTLHPGLKSHNVKCGLVRGSETAVSLSS